MGRREDGDEAQGEDQRCRGRSRARGGRTRARSPPGIAALGGALWFWRRKSSRRRAAAGAPRASAVSLIRAALDGLTPYEPGKPEEELQRELGLERVVKLASNEGPWGPFPAAIEALERSAPLLNRYPDGGAFHLRNALAERHGVDPRERDHRRRRGRPDRPSLGGDARSRRRDRHRLAVVRQLRPRRAQARRGAAEGAARRRPLRPRRAARGDRPAHEARLRRDAEQPDGNDDDAQRSSTRTSSAFPSTCSRCSTRRTSSTSSTRTIRTASRST